MDDFPIQIPKRLPARISPCPIVEAIAEFRFTTTESWTNLPGLLSRCLKERFPKQVNLPINEFPLPESARAGDPMFRHQPHVQFLSEGYLIQLGPQVVSVTTRGPYRGWIALREQVEWVLYQVKQADIIQEGERIGLRYIDFFEGNLFDHLDATFEFGGLSLTGPELSVTKVMRHEPFQARLLLSNSATTKIEGKARRGGVLDLDVSLGPRDFELFENSIETLEKAHTLNKQVFFGLLKPEYLESLNPKYDES